MEWYSGSGIDDFVVPEDQEVYDRLPSPESWSKWCADASESHEFSNKRFLMDSKSTEEELKFNGEILSNEVKSFYNGKDQSSGSSINGGLSEESLPQTALSCDQPVYQLDDLSEIEQLDEFFLSSFLEDLPSNENLHGSFCFSPEAECDMASADNHLTDTISDLKSISNDEHGTGSSKYLKTHAFSPSVSWEEGEDDASHFNPCNSNQKDWALAKASLVNDSVPSEHDSTIGLVDEETSLQQSALQELEMVMAQLNDKTRICFRDALYRLASNSRRHIVKQDQNGDLSMETPGTDEDEKMRSGEKTIEMETNTIDRAIANLMFSKMDLNMRDFPISASVSSKQGISRDTKPLNCSSSWNQPQGRDLPSYPSFSGDAEVPILGQGYLQI